MTGKEMLELAAKAVGIELCWNDVEAPGYYSEWRGMPQWEYWNPIVFDGEALRLAVKLEITIAPSMEQTSARNASYTGWMNEDASRDSFAATRRAIVRAAAEIGKGM